MHRGSVAALLLSGGTGASVNAQHVSAIMGVHDIAEAIAGDITPHDGISKHDKEMMEEVL
jgi:putative hydrolases of HD superfamily